MSAALIVSGKVIDAGTKLPIKAFRVVPGIRSDKSTVYWDGSGTLSASDGQYRIRHLPRVFRDIWFASKPTAIDQPYHGISRVTKGRSPSISSWNPEKTSSPKSVTPRNAPAVGATIVLAFVGTQIHMLNGEIPAGPTYCPRAITDDTGSFHFPAQDSSFKLIITHPSGLAQFSSRANGNWRGLFTWNLGPESKGRFESDRNRWLMRGSRLVLIARPTCWAMRGRTSWLIISPPQVRTDDLSSIA